jgi:hypothetical protein
MSELFQSDIDQRDQIFALARAIVDTGNLVIIDNFQYARPKAIWENEPEPGHLVRLEATLDHSVLDGRIPPITKVRCTDSIDGNAIDTEDTSPDYGGLIDPRKPLTGWSRVMTTMIIQSLTTHFQPPAERSIKFDLGEDHPDDYWVKISSAPEGV